jgi:hypothetical protein
MNPPFHPPSVCPPVNLSLFHLPHTETCQWGPHPSSVFLTFLPSLGHSFHTGAPVSVFCTSFPHLFILSCTNTFHYQSLLLSSLLVTYFPFGHTQPMSPSVGALLPIHPSPASSISSKHYPGHLPSSSEFVHLVPPLAQLISDLVVPLTLDLVTRLRPHLLPCTLQPREILSLPTS